MAAEMKDLSQDGPWSVVFSSFMAQLLAFGSPQSVGVIYPEWLSTFHEGKSTTAWVGSTVLGVGLITSPLCSACVDNFGARPVTIFSGVMVAGGLMLSAFAPNIIFLIFSYGIVVGLGCGLVYAATLTVTCQYFDKRRGLALGIVTTGTSIGGFMYASMQNKLIGHYGLEGCLLIVGALALNLIACAGPMRPLNLPGYYIRQKAALKCADESLYDKELVTEPLVEHQTLVCIIKKHLQPHPEYMHGMRECLREPSFVSLCVSFFLYSLGAIPPVLFMEDVAQSEGLLDHVTPIPLVSITAAATVVGKLALGMLADVHWVNSLQLYAMTVAAMGTALLVVPMWKSYAGLQVISAVIGFFSGNWSITSYVTTRIVGIERLGQAHGLLMCSGGFGIILGPPVVGLFFDWTQSYDLPFYFTGCCLLVGGAVPFITASLCKNPVNKNKKNALADLNDDIVQELKNPSVCNRVTSELEHVSEEDLVASHCLPSLAVPASTPDNGYETHH
ncbi:monocarboxylate transporter 9a isoform X1 [Silurus meridionalis]|uniref:monocarboxylate transporter 9a isoform X1 n=1 Tax=Silurus meridionalis TaxID=175797 RepID=UPI001EEC351B|nr:monocarboxylate transporter 9a isoform X1 [Silurus meridionalis]